MNLSAKYVAKSGLKNLIFALWSTLFALKVEDDPNLFAQVDQISQNLQLLNKHKNLYSSKQAFDVKQMQSSGSRLSKAEMIQYDIGTLKAIFSKQDKAKSGHE